VSAPIATHIRLEDGTLWPHPVAAGELEWRLRYDHAALTREDLLRAASMISAYVRVAMVPAAGKQMPMIRRAQHGAGTASPQDQGGESRGSK